MILSFDVGICNISYAIISAELDVVAWRVCNLKSGCVALRARGHEKRCACGRVATSYRCDVAHEEIYECKSHATTTSDAATTSALKERLIDVLEGIDTTHVTHVVIENQPSLKNPTMKSIAETIYCYFLIRARDRRQSYEVCYVAATQKNKLERYVAVEVERAFEKKKGYARSKAQVVEYCGAALEQLCGNGAKWSEWWEMHKKRDDLADSLVQGVVFIYSRLR